ncbi:hypothetical protein [Bradymonas sediminis]|uniref:Uncharacterized protein n=1 Tax=Bradymonas sediminis TaxID=1548548 RepID=A0A2Z4FM16_9DELT|nr:hypothetical protein [Bradymonas sediminis]AWV89796.1 hypothetical protein DN745_10785 [Bradymonas sediminis]TDP76457.1 hypothetical protein DFR33_10286 [Bradymonas sediminis]
MKKRSISLLAASLLVLTVSQSASAQETPDAQAEQAAPASSEETAVAQAQDEAPASDDAEQDAPAEDAQSAEAAPSAAAVGEAPAAEPLTGPGGKPLREDYPGTEESKRARMDTERIEGLTFNEGETAEDVYDLRIRELETKVDDLKETVFRSKTRIVLLKETVLNSTISGSRAIVSHQNELGNTYVLEHALYSLDGARIFNEKDKDGTLSDRGQFDVFKGAIAPGTHRISVMMELKGSGYKLFNYMDGYKFRVQDSCEFTAQEGRGVTVKVRLYEKGGALTSYEDRLGVDCTVNLVALSEAEVVDAKAEVSTDPAAAAVESAPDAP